MTELLTFSLIIAAILGYSLYEAKRRISTLEQAIKESEKKVAEANQRTVISEDDLKKRAIAIYWRFQRDPHHETGLYVERDPTGENHDCVTERYERELDDFGRCTTEWRHTDCEDMILRSEYQYPDGPSEEPIREIYYDEHGAKEVWIDALLDEKGRTQAYIRSRRFNDLKDVVLFERDSTGILRRQFERSHVKWPYSVEDVPTKFHSEFPTGEPSTTEYDYFEVTPPNPKFPPELQRIKRGSNIKEIEQHNGSPRQIVETDYDGLKSATHYFANEDDAAVTVIIRRGMPPVEVQIDLAKNQLATAEKFIDVTAKSNAQPQR